MKHFIIVVILAAFCCYVEAQITCYSCDYSTFQIDSDTLIGSGDATCNGDWTSDDATSAATCSDKWCYKIVFSQNSATYSQTTRGCISDCTPGTQTIGDFTGYQYCCQGNKCNSASGLIPHHLAIAASALLALMLVLMNVKY